MASFPTEDLNPWVAQIGGILNLLTESGGTTTLNAQWFSNPWDNGIATIPTRPRPLMQFFDHLLPSEGAIPAGFPTPTDAGTPLTWYDIPLVGASTGTYIILSDPNADYSAADALIGLGLSADIAAAGVTVAADLPAMSLSEDTGGNVVICSADAEAQVAAIITLSAPQEIEAGTYDMVQVMGTLQLGEKATGSKVTLRFLQSQANGPARDMASYDTLQSALAARVFTAANAANAQPSVEGWLTTAITQNGSVTPGDVFNILGLLTDGANQAYLVNETQLQEYAQTIETDGLAAGLKEIALQMVFGVLDQLASNEEPLVPISTGGLYVSAVEGTGDLEGTTDCGINLQLPDFALGSVPSESGTGTEPSTGTNATQPQMLLQVGK